MARVKISLRQIIGILMLLGIMAVVGGESLWKLYATHQDYSIIFPRSTYLTDDAQVTLNEVAGIMKRDPDLSVKIEGHTSLRGDAEANMQLSIRRAEKVKDELVYLGIGEHRVMTEGKGGMEPLKQHAGESDTAYQQRLSRVEISIGRFLK